MKIKNNKGVAGVDIVIAIIAITIFSTLIISMIYSNVTENVKLKKENVAMIAITEIFEKVGIENYSNLENGTYNDIGNNDYSEVIENLIPQYAIDNFKVDLGITNQLEDVSNTEDIIKKIQITLTYEVGNKTYNCSMQRMKVKE